MTSLPNSASILNLKGKFDDLTSFEERLLNVLDEAQSLTSDRLPKINARLNDLLPQKAPAAPAATTIPSGSRPAYAPAGYQPAGIYGRPPAGYPGYPQANMGYPSYSGAPVYRPPY